MAIRRRVEGSRGHDVLVGWNGLKVMLLDEYTGRTFGENVRPTPSVRGQFDGDVRRIKWIDQCPARLDLTEIRFEWEIRLRAIAPAGRSGASDNSSGRKQRNIWKRCMRQVVADARIPVRIELSIIPDLITAAGSTDA